VPDRYPLTPHTRVSPYKKRQGTLGAGRNKIKLEEQYRMSNSEYRSKKKKNILILDFDTQQITRVSPEERKLSVPP